jgi:hypothetical protein
MKLQRFDVSKCVIKFVVCVAAVAPNVSTAEVTLERKANWNWPSSADLSQQFSDYAAQSSNQQADAIRAWNDAATNTKGPSLLEHWVRALAVTDTNLDQWIDQLTSKDSRLKPAEVQERFDSISGSMPAYVQNNLRLFAGRYLAQRQFYDEAIHMLEPLKLEDVVDPSTLLFCRATSYHHLLRRDDCVTAIDTLLERESELVSRYAVIAKLMKADIAPMEEDSLDEVARLMNDVQRRLDLERSGKVVRDQEDSIIEKLDKTIDDIEKQLQEMQKQQKLAQGQQSQQPQGGGTPMQDSQIAGTSGDGNVDKKDLGKMAGWGDLPPAQRQEALQKMTQDLPSHYREIIEAYFKRLATEGR